MGSKRECGRVDTIRPASGRWSVAHIASLFVHTMMRFKWQDRIIPRPAVHCVDIDELLAIHRGPVSSCFCTTNRFVIIIIQYCWFRCVIQDGLLAACQSLIEMDAKELRWSGSGNSHGDECSYNMRKRLDRQCITFCAAFLHHYYGAEWKGHFPLLSIVVTDDETC